MPLPLVSDFRDLSKEHNAPYCPLPELVRTLRGLLDVVRALVPLGVF